MKLNTFNKGLAYSIICIITVMIAIISCNKVEKTHNEYLPSQVSIPTDIQTSPIIQDIFGKRISGSITIYNTANGEILISLSDKEGKRASSNFILQTTLKGSNLARVEKIESAEVLYMRDFVLVNDLQSGRLINYRVNTANYERVYTLLSPELQNEEVVNIDGYGLSYHQGTWDNLNENISLEGSIEAALFPIKKGNRAAPDDGGGTGVSCTSGGTGSSSCSLNCGSYNPQSCSVSCVAGYYACCGCTSSPYFTALCKCVKN